VATKTELAELANLSPAQLSYFLGFASLPKNVTSQFADIKGISVRTGYALSVAITQGFESQILRDIRKIESGEIQRDQIPIVWREKRDISHAPDTEGSAQNSTDSTRSKVVSKVAIYKSSTGRVLCKSKVNVDGAVTLKLTKEFAAKLDDAKLKKVLALIEELTSKA
jgi:hypothetical protein